MHAKLVAGRLGGLVNKHGSSSIAGSQQAHDIGCGSDCVARRDPIVDDENTVVRI